MLGVRVVERRRRRAVMGLPQVRAEGAEPFIVARDVVGSVGLADAGFLADGLAAPAQRTHAACQARSSVVRWRSVMDWPQPAQMGMMEDSMNRIRVARDRKTWIAKRLEHEAPKRREEHDPIYCSRGR